MLAIDYRLAPEHKHPDMVHDALAALAWLWDHGPDCTTPDGTTPDGTTPDCTMPDGAMPARSVIVVGDSAGGGLAVSLCVALLANPTGL